MLDSNNADVNLDSDSSTEDTTSSVEVDKENTDAEDTKENQDENNKKSDEKVKDKKDSKDKKKPYHEIPRFKQIIEERNKEKERADKLEAELNKIRTLNNSQAQSQNNSNDQSNNKSNFKFGMLDDVLGEKVDYPFKNPNEYSTIGDLYKDLRDAFFNDLFKVNKQASDQELQKTTQLQQSIKADLDGVEQYFGDDQDRRDSFFEFVIDEIKNGNKADVYSLLKVWERFNPKGEANKNTDRSKTNKILSKGISGNSRNNVQQGYNPVTDRKKDMFQLASEVFGK